MAGLNALTRHLQPRAIQARERAQIRAIKGSIGHVEVFRMDGVGISISGGPRPLPGHDTPNPAHNTYTLKCEEPVKRLHSVWLSVELVVVDLRMLSIKICCHCSFLLEWNVWCAKESLAGFLGAFDVCDLEESFG